MRMWASPLESGRASPPCPLSIRGWRGGRVMAAVVALVVLVVMPAVALAHPLGNFTINRYGRIELFDERVAVRYVVDMAEIPTFQEMSALDADGDGQVSDGERTAYLERKTVELRR